MISNISSAFHEYLRGLSDEQWAALVAEVRTPAGGAPSLAGVTQSRRPLPRLAPLVAYRRVPSCTGGPTHRRPTTRTLHPNSRRQPSRAWQRAPNCTTGATPRPPNSHPTN